MLKRAWHNMYPAGVPYEIEFEKITIPEMLARTREKFPDNTALSYEGRLISYRELYALVNRFAQALLNLGIGKGKKVAVLMPNAPQIVVACQAVLRVGAVTVMNNPLYTETELERQLNDSGASVLIITDESLEKALNLRKKTAVRTIITSSMSDYAPTDEKQVQSRAPAAPDLYRFLDLIDQATPEPVDNAAQWDDVANIIYTGGTTGASKGVMLTHANLSSNVQQYSVWMHSTVDGEESWPMVYPIFHSAGYTMQNKSIYTGWKSILVPRPTPEILVDIIANQKPSLLPGVATLFVGLLNFNKFCELDLSFIKAFMTGGGPLTVETLNQLKALRDAPVINVYGLSECSPVATATPWGGNEKDGSVGVPYPSTDMKIVDSTNAMHEMPTGEPGEILLKGPQVMKGYLNQPEETRKVLKDGWLHTGDVGFVDAFGYLTIVDRKKDVIVASGFNVYPKEIDELLFAHPKILEACTIGVPHEYRGETVKSYIVLKPGENTTTDDLVAYCKEHLAPYKVPRLFEFIDTLPKSAVGKILRKDLRELDRGRG